MRCLDLAQRRNHSLVSWNDKFAEPKRDTGARTGDSEVPGDGKLT